MGDGGLDLKDDYLLIGKVVKTHGIRGELKIFPYSRIPENFKSYKNVTLTGGKAGLCRSYPVDSCRIHKKTVILRLAGVATMDDAERLCGFQVWLRKSELPAAGPDEYYWYEMAGRQVVTDQGRELGRVTAVFNNGAHDVLVIMDRDREYLVPVRPEIVVRLDSSRRQIIISPVPGLLDLEDLED